MLASRSNFGGRRFLARRGLRDLRCSGKIPPEFLIHAFLGVDVAIDRFLADAQFGTFIDHAVPDLLGCPALLDALDGAFAQIRMPDQFALPGSSLLRALVCCHPEVSGVFLREGIIGPEVTFDLAEDR